MSPVDTVMKLECEIGAKSERFTAGSKYLKHVPNHTNKAGFSKEEGSRQISLIPCCFCKQIPLPISFSIQAQKLLFVGVMPEKAMKNKRAEWGKPEPRADVLMRPICGLRGPIYKTMTRAWEYLR